MRDVLYAVDDLPEAPPDSGRGAVGRLRFERQGMILHATLNAMNHSRNAFARDVLLELIEEQPTLGKAWGFLGSATGRMGDAEGALPFHERAVELAPTDASLHSTLIFALDQAPTVTLERAYRARRAYNDLVKVDPLLIAPHQNDRDPERRLRIGYASADFRAHSAGSRLAVFARKPAPVQVTAWGYITGTGLDAIDYLFADADTIHPDEERWYAEEVVRLPRILTCWAPDLTAIGPVGPLPADTNGHLTFGVFNRLGKIQPPCAAAWAEILRRLPDARLICKCPGLDDPAARLLLEAMFDEAGAPLERLEFRGATNQDDHLRTYGLIDVALDPSPHGGGMSTFDAAWRGVPTLTLPHIQIPSRIATTVAHELGLNYLVADSWDDYIARAVALDTQRDELRKVRKLMHDMMSVSAFGDHIGYARATESIYRDLWRRWCTGDAPQRLRAVS